jgi:protein ImuB
MYSVIYIPDFHLQAALRGEPALLSRPVALLDGQLPKANVFQMTPAARAAGVTPGLTSTQAAARCADVILRSRSPAQEQAARDILLQCAYGFSPAIEDTADGVCSLDLKGLSFAADLENPQESIRRLAAAEIRRWGEKIIDSLFQLQLRAQAGAAKTPRLAWLAAKSAQPFRLVLNADEFVSDLPVAELEPPPDIAEILEKWGIRTAGAFLALGKDKISERLGVDAVELFELASGQESRPLRLVVPAETFEESVEFEEPIEMLEPLLFILRRLVEQLSLRLQTVYLNVSEMNLRLELCDGANYQKLFRIPAPTHKVDTLFRTLHTHLENAKTDSPIRAVHLCFRPCKPRQDQFSLFEATLRDPNQFHETVARLEALLGSGRAGTPFVKDSHRPDSFEMDATFLCRGQEDESAGRKPAAVISRSQGFALRRLRPPVIAKVELRENRPAVVNSAVVTGAIVKARGPWRISGNWWENEEWVRQEWDVQTGDGALFRLVEESGEWRVEGVMD